MRISLESKDLVYDHYLHHLSLDRQLDRQLQSIFRWAVHLELLQPLLLDYLIRHRNHHQYLFEYVLFTSSLWVRLQNKFYKKKHVLLEQNYQLVCKMSLVKSLPEVHHGNSKTNHTETSDRENGRIIQVKNEIWLKRNNTKYLLDYRLQSNWKQKSLRHYRKFPRRGWKVILAKLLDWPPLFRNTWMHLPNLIRLHLPYRQNDQQKKTP